MNEEPHLNEEPHMFCPECGAKLLKTAKFCNKCGVQININIHAEQNINTNVSKKSMRNTRVSQNAQFSQNTQISHQNTRNSMEYEVNNTNISNTFVRKKKSSKAVWIIVPSILVVLAVCAFIYFKAAKGPADTVDSILACLDQMDVVSVLDYCSPSVRRTYDGLFALGDSVLGLLGMDSDLKAFAGAVSPLLPSFYGADWYVDWEIVNVEYSGGVYDSLPFKADCFGNVFADYAVVTVDIYATGEPQGMEQWHLKNYGSDGWLLEDNAIEDLMKM